MNFYRIFVQMLFLIGLQTSIIAQEQKDNPLDKSITISCRDVPVKEALKLISQKAGVTFTYSNDLVSLPQNVTLDITGKPLRYVLNQILKETNIEFKVIGNQVIFQTRKAFPKNHTISGYLREEGSAELLTGVNIYVSSLKKGTVSNTFGFYSLTLPAEDSITVFYSFVGYTTVVKRITLLDNQEININLKAGKLLNEVVVNADANSKLSENAQMSQITITNKDVKKLPGLLGEADVMRVLQILPGIQAANERSTGISVRGGSIDQNLFLLDDAPVFQISHLMGFYSVFNNDAVKDIRIYKGDIPANYGGRLSSIVDIRLKDGNMQNYAVSGGLGLICSDLSVEGPIVKNRASFIVSGKYSYLGWIYKYLEPNVDLTFYDLNCKLNVVINSKNRIYLSSYNGNDNATLGLRANYHNNTMSIRLNHVYNPKLFSNVSLIYSNFKYSTAYNSTNGNSSIDYSWNSGIRQFTLKAEYNYYLNNNNTIDFGASTTYRNFIPGKLEGNKTAIESIAKAQPFSNRVVDRQGVFEHVIYISNQQKITDKLSFKYGVRASLYQNIGGHWVYNLKNNQVADSFYAAKNKTYSNSYSVEPRIGINYRISCNSAIKASYSYTTQQDQLLMKTNGGGPLDVWFPSDNNIKPQTSSQYSLGYVQYLFNNVLEASIEGYYKDMNHIIDYKDGASFLVNNSLYRIDKTSYNFEEQLRTGKGYAYGTELMLKSNFEKLNGFVSYTYARSYRKISDINLGQRYLSPFDKPHTFNLFLNYNISKRLSVSTNYRSQSGQVTTIPIYVMGLWGKTLTGYSNRNEYRLPPYQRLDISLTIKNKQTTGKHYHSEWNFSVINMLNHANIQYVNFIAPKDNSNTINATGVSMLGVIPSVSYHFNF